METSDSKNDNELWNEMHVSLVRDLEKKGILWRYSTKHLRLWTDLILAGKSSGCGEEPQWELHLEQIIVPPKSRRTSSPGSSASSSCSSNNSSASTSQSNGNLMEMRLLQNQQKIMEDSKRTELFQTALLAMMSNNCKLPQPQVYIIINYIIVYSPLTHSYENWILHHY